MSSGQKLPNSEEWKYASNGKEAAIGVLLSQKRDSEKIYVGRATHNGDLLPGKIVPSEGCYVSYNGQELIKKSYQVLCDPHLSVEWVADSDGNVPSGAIQGGVTVDDEPLYIGRVMHERETAVGKIHPSHHCCYIPFGKFEHKYNSYEVLIRKTVSPQGK